MNEERGPVKADPGLVFGISLIAALVISWPGFSSAMRGSADIMAVGARFLVAVAAVWSGLYLVSSLIAGFATASSSVAADRAANSAQATSGQATTGAALDAGRLDASTSGGATLPPALEAAAAAAIAAETEHAAG